MYILEIEMYILEAEMYILGIEMYIPGVEMYILIDFSYLFSMIKIFLFTIRLLFIWKRH